MVLSYFMDMNIIMKDIKIRIVNIFSWNKIFVMEIYKFRYIILKYICINLLSYDWEMLIYCKSFNLDVIYIYINMYMYIKLSWFDKNEWI